MLVRVISIATMHCIPNCISHIDQPFMQHNMSRTIPYLDGIWCCRWCSSRKDTNIIHLHPQLLQHRLQISNLVKTHRSIHSSPRIQPVKLYFWQHAVGGLHWKHSQISRSNYPSLKLATKWPFNTYVTFGPCIWHTTFTRNFRMFTETNVHKKHRPAKPGTFAVISLPKNDHGENLSTHKPMFWWKMTSSLGDKKWHYFGHPIFHWTMIYGLKIN